MTRMSTVPVELPALLKKWDMKVFQLQETLSWNYVEEEDEGNGIDIELSSRTSYCKVHLKLIVTRSGVSSPVDMLRYTVDGDWSVGRNT